MPKRRRKPLGFVATVVLENTFCMFLCSFADDHIFFDGVDNHTFFDSVLPPADNHFFDSVLPLADNHTF